MAMSLLLTCFAAGLMSFFSPCIVPVLPGFFAFLVGDESGAARRFPSRTVYRTGAFILGFGIMFVLMGTAAGGLGRLLTRYLREINIIGGALVVFFGLHMLGLFQVPFLMRGGFSAPRGTSGFVLGVAMSAAWTPCVGPFLASVLMMAAAAGSPLWGGVLLGAFAAGLGLPFLAGAVLWARFAVRARSMSRWSHHLSRIGGVVLVAVGFMMMTGVFSRLVVIF